MCTKSLKQLQSLSIALPRIFQAGLFTGLILLQLSSLAQIMVPYEYIHAQHVLHAGGKSKSNLGDFLPSS